MATATDAAIVEQTKALIEIKPKLEGFEDYGRLNIADAAKPPVEDQRLFYSERKQLLEAAIAANEALMAHGHPDLPVAKAEAKAYASLQAQQATIAAALEMFEPVAALDHLEHTFTVRPK